MTELPTKEIATTTRERIAGEGARRARIESLPGEGFNPEQRHWINDRLTDIAFPVDKIKSLHRKPNARGCENYLGSWTPWSGEFSIYELLDSQIKEKQLGTIVHESGHANSPLKTENTFLFGSEGAQKAAAEHTRSVATQTDLTEKYLNGYHRYLHEKYKNGEIDRNRFDEETWAIMAELALTNRAHLKQVQESQHKALERRKGTGKKDPDKVYLMSHEEKGEMVVDGVDVAMINLVDGVDDLRSLKEHALFLKGEFYSNDNYQQVLDRRRLEEKKKKEEEEAKGKADKLSAELARLDELDELAKK